MELDTLRQKSGFERKQFILEQDRLRIKTQKPGENWDFTVRYEDIGFETMTKSDSKNRYLPYFFIPMIGLNVALMINSANNREPNMYAQLGFWMFGFILFAVFFVISMIGRKKAYIYLTGGEKTVELFSNKPDDVTVGQFIEQIYEKIRRVNKEKYEELQKNAMSFEWHEQWLGYLLKIKAITAEEKEEKLAQLKNAGNTPIGFQVTNS